MSKDKIDKHAVLRAKASKKRTFSGENYLVLPDDVEFWSPEKPDVEYRLDILPYAVAASDHPDGIPVGETWYTRPFQIHRDMGVNKARVICPRSFGLACPVCELANKLSRDPDADKDVLKALWPSERAIYNVICLDEKEPTVKVFDVSRFLFGEKMERKVAHSVEERGNFYELKGGLTLVCLFEERKGGGFTSLTLDEISFEKRPDYEPDWLDEVVALDEVLVEMKYEEIDEMLQGVGHPAPEQEEEKVAPTRKRRTAPEPEEEDDIPMDNAPAVEEEAPKRRRRVVEDEEEAPKRRQRRSS